MRSWRLDTGNLLCLWLGMILALPANGQSDSTIAAPTIETPDPNAALRRAFVPGWGQLYNHEYYKIPIVYVGLAAFVGSAILVNEQYQLHQHAYLFTARIEMDGVPTFPEYESDYMTLLSDLNLRSESSLMPEEINMRRARLEPQIRERRDNLRRNRDLLYLGVIAWYGFTIIDAYVSAHLSEFDVNESLSLRVSGGLERLGLSITW